MIHDHLLGIEPQPAGEFHQKARAHPVGDATSRWFAEQDKRVVDEEGR
jgi:hypothetical protein